MRLDNWQKDVLECKTNMLLCSGRQTGKSFICSIKAVTEALSKPDFSVLIVSATERQSEELLQKCLIYAGDVALRKIMKGVNRPTKHTIRFLNGSVIRCLPTSQTGAGIRGFTVNLLICDEASYIPDSVFAALTPMLLTTGGKIWLISTPRGKNGFFWERYNDPNYTVFHVNSEQVMKDREISESWTQAQRDGAMAYLESEKLSMTEKVYGQEYLGLFQTDLNRWFSDELIEKVCVAHRKGYYPANYYLGVDVAAMGEDQSTFEIVDKKDKDHFTHIESITTTKTRITDTINKILELDRIYKFQKIYIDDAGVGVGVFDFLLQNDQTKRRVVAINNARRALDKDNKHKKGLVKEDIYNNMLVLLEHDQCHLLKDDEVILSLKSIQYEYVMRENESTRLRIYGSYSHICEGIARALYCNKEKHANLWIGSRSIQA